MNKITFESAGREPAFRGVTKTHFPEQKDTNRQEKVWKDRYKVALTNLENSDLIEMVEQTKTTREGGKKMLLLSLNIFKGSWEN